MANAIEFLLQMNDKFTGPTDKATQVLRAFDNQIQKDADSIAKLEDKLSAASKKLDAMRAPKAITDLQNSLRAAEIARAHAFQSGDMAGFNKAAKEATAIQAKLNVAREKQAASVSQQEGVVKALQQQLTRQREGKAAVEAALPAWQRWATTIGANKEKLAGLADQAAQVGGPIGSLAGRAKQLTELLGKGGLVGAIVVAAVAFAALVAGIVAAGVALAAYALKAADAARSSALLSEAAAGSAAMGANLEAAVSQLATRLPIARDKLADMARGLEAARLEGREMQLALEAIGIVASARGEQAAGKIRAIAESSKQARRFLLGARDVYGEFASLSGTGIKSADMYRALAVSMRKSIPEVQRLVLAGAVPVKEGLDALSIAAQQKFGNIVDRQMLSLPNLLAKVKESIGLLFADVDIEGFLSGLKSITDLFSQDTATGRVLKEVLTSALNSFFKLAEKAFPYVRAALIGVLVAGLYLLVAFKRMGKAIAEALGLKDIGGGPDKIMLAFKLGVAAVGAFVGALLFLGVVMASLAISAAILTAPLWLPFVLGAAAVFLMYKAIIGIGEAVASTFNAIKNIDLAQAGKDLIDGLINGIKSKVGAVVDAVSNIGSAIKSAFTGEMEIRSPSRVMMRYADHTVDGYAMQLERRTPDAEAAMVGLGGGRPGQLEAGGARQGPMFEAMFKDCTFGSDAEETGRVVDERLRMFFLAQSGGLA